MSWLILFRGFFMQTEMIDQTGHMPRVQAELILLWEYRSLAHAHALANFLSANE